MILIDLNVVLDVVQKRQPHYKSSALVLEEVVAGRIAACLPAHAFTTLHYLVARYQTTEKADQVVRWLLRYFEVAGTTRSELLRACEFGWHDFEDAVVAATAESAGSVCIVTRNIRDFVNSPIATLTPEEYLLDQDKY